MPLTPNDIHNKTFTKAFRGYDEDEVNEFLNQVRKDYEIVLRKKTELEAKVNELDERLGHFSTIEETLNKSILVAQEARGRKAQPLKKKRSSSSAKLRRTQTGSSMKHCPNRERSPWKSKS